MTGASNIGRTHSDMINMALAFLGEPPVVNDRDTRLSVRQCVSCLPLVQATVFRSHEWNSLLRRARLNRESETRWGNKWRYKLPPDCERVIELNGQRAKTAPSFRREGDCLVTAAESVEILYVANPGTDYSGLSSSLYAVVAMALALHVAPSIKLNIHVLDRLHARYETMLADAVFSESTESTPRRPIGENDWLDFAMGRGEIVYPHDIYIDHKE